MRVMVVLGLWLAGCHGDRSPLCSTLRFSPIDVSIDEEITFSWEGSDAQLFAVIDPEGAPMWELYCACPEDEDGEPRCRTEEDYVEAACLSGPIVYGEVPDVGLREEDSAQFEAQPLQAGVEYTAIVSTPCEVSWGRRKVEDRDFVAP